MINKVSFMIITIGVAMLFFTLGYGYAAKRQVLDCNEFIKQEVLPDCPGYGFTKIDIPKLGGEDEKNPISNFNFTQS